VFLKKQNPWLSEVYSQTLQASLKNLEAAYTMFFKGVTEFPQFKKKHAKQSFRVPQHFSVDLKSVTLPKVGKIRAKIHRSFGDKLCNITISKTSVGKYYASVLCETVIPEPRFEGDVIGIDLGIKDYLVDSDGRRVPNPKYLQRNLAKLQRLQQLRDKMILGSRDRHRMNLRVARLHDKIQNQRSDFQHKLSLQLVRENQTICCETLAVKKMLVEAYPSLARHIADAGWYSFLTKLDYKGRWYGCKIRSIQQFFPSSKRHFECGYVNDKLTLSEREWLCPSCNQMVDRDHNAAKNILQVGVTFVKPSSESNPNNIAVGTL
jgi:putative transposase